MAIAQTTTNSFKVETLQAIHNFGPTDPDVFMLALYDASATIGPATTEYTTGGEITGTGYTEGGIILTISTFPSLGTNVLNIPTAYIGFGNAQWPDASFTARGGLIYNASKDNRSVAVLDFGADKTVVNKPFTVVFPVANVNSAIIRIG